MNFDYIRLTNNNKQGKGGCDFTMNIYDAGIEPILIFKLKLSPVLQNWLEIPVPYANFWRYEVAFPLTDHLLTKE